MTNRNARQQVEQLFQQIVDFNDKERAAFITSYSGDAHILEEAMKLVAIHDGHNDSTIGKPFMEWSDEAVGTMIGSYKLLEAIGEGGFGTVFMAEQQEPVVRKVALKVIKLGMDTRQVIARFEAERQALAMMDHPNIARVLDAGATEEGRPYFVMELVRGVPLNEYCDANRLTLQDRLEVLIQVCQAVQHAHQKGIIHRDLKPSNILITLHDGRPVPKVIDFGIAKATNQRLTEKTLFTQHRQMIGTPQYMSPEQAEMSGLDIDTRSDIYSLGVILYELLTGTPPFTAEMLRSAGFGELQRIIREVEPPRPSVRISTMGGQLDAVARSRALEARGLGRIIRGDLDWIVMTALDKDRRRRYASASDLASDLQRYLDGEPVNAVPPSSSYKLRKFLGRNKGAVSVTALILMLVIGGGALSTYFAFRAKEQAQRAIQAERIARQKASEASLAYELSEEKARENARLVYAGIIRTTEKAIENGGLDVARRLLDSCPSEQRNWEWHWLERKIDGRPRSVGEHTRNGIRSVAYSPDGDLVASGGYDNTACIWDLKSSKLIHRLEGHEEVVTGVAFSPDQQLLATSAANASVYVWDVTNGQLIKKLAGHDSWLAGVRFSPDGTMLASYGGNSNLRLWRVEDLSLIASLNGYTHDVWGLDFSPDSTRIATSTGDGKIVVWSVSEQKRLWETKISEFGCWSIRYAPSGKRLVTAGFDNLATVWDAANGQRLFDLDGYNVPVRAAEYSPDGAMIVVAGYGALRSYAARTGDRLDELLTPQGEMNSIHFHPSGNRLISGGGNKQVLEWTTAMLGGPIDLVGHSGLVYEAAMSGDGRHSYSTGADGGLRAWNTMTAAPSWVRFGSPEIVRSVAVDEHSKLVIWHEDAGRLTAVNKDTGASVWSRDVDPRTWYLCIHAESSMLLAAAPINSVERGQPVDLALWDASKGEVLRILHGHQAPVRRVVFSRDGQLAASCDRGGEVIVWNVMNGSIRQRIRTDDDVTPFAVELTEKSLFVGNTNGGISIWDIDSGKRDRSFYAHNSNIGAMDLTEDGKRLMTSAWHNPEIRIWNAETDELLLELDTSITGLADARFMPGDRGIVTSGMDGRLRIWELDSPIGAFPARRAAQAQAREKYDELQSLLIELDRAFTEFARQRQAGALTEVLAEIHEWERRTELVLPIDHPYRKDLQKHRAWTVARKRASDDPLTLSPQRLNQLAGVYGERVISVVDGGIRYSHQRYQGEHDLTPLDQHTFQSTTVDGFRLKFDQEKDGIPCRLLGIQLDGQIDESWRQGCEDRG
ncbi:MAG: protein kinase domain-containing protein [Phycisphaerae bacterium]